MKISVVILTQGNRPRELDRAVRSALAQDDADIEVVIVGNGAPVPELTCIDEGSIKTINLPENEGIPGGRNKGAEACSGDILMFLDDDGWYDSTGIATRVLNRFSSEPDLAVLSFRVTDPDGGPGQRRHVPRLRVGDPARSSPVTTFLGGACAIRRSAYDQAGGLPSRFFYAHEETDLSWRLLDLGYRIEYDTGLVMFHPQLPPTRHTRFHRNNARNRVWLARRNLPWPIAALYLVDWIALTLVRERSLPALRAWFKGFLEGLRTDPGPRRPISWRTAWRMLRLGRPPII